MIGPWREKYSIQSPAYGGGSGSLVPMQQGLWLGSMGSRHGQIVAPGSSRGQGGRQHCPRLLQPPSHRTRVPSTSRRSPREGSRRPGTRLPDPAPCGPAAQSGPSPCRRRRQQRGLLLPLLLRLETWHEASPERGALQQRQPAAVNSQQRQQQGEGGARSARDTRARPPGPDLPSARTPLLLHPFLCACFLGGEGLDSLLPPSTIGS